MEPDDRIVAAAVWASEAVLGRPAVIELSGGHLPDARHLRRQRRPAGGADDDARAHTPDESFGLDYRRPRPR
jgi:hypothetical protein